MTEGPAREKVKIQASWVGMRRTTSMLVDRKRKGQESCEAEV